MIGIILGILGVLLTLTFGVYSIWSYKKSKRNTSLEFKKKECYSLFRDDVKRLNIELNYNQQPISNTLILLKAILKNNGKTDIDKNRIYKPLKIISTNEFKWLEVRITNGPEGSSTNINLINSKEIELIWDLLKAEEFIEIEALVEIVKDQELEEDKAITFYNKLSFDYRITDLKNIQKEKQISKNDKIRFTKLVEITAFIIGLILTVFSYLPITRQSLQNYNVEYILKTDSVKRIVNVNGVDNNEISLKIINSDEKIKLSIDDFNKKYKIDKIEKLTPEDSNINLFIRIFGFVYLIMSILLIILRILTNKEKSKIKKLILENPLE